MLIYNRSARTNNNLLVKMNPQANFNEFNELINQKPIEKYKCNLDLVYVIRPGEINTDLRYSLRSIEKFCSFRKIWIVGFKPKWVQNVGYIPTVQNLSKWQNSTINCIAACKSNEISENFVLMNDDFFAIRPIKDWVKDTNVCLGQLSDYVEKFSNLKNPSKWQAAFKPVDSLLKKLGCSQTYNYEAHLPMLINKKKFLNAISQPEAKRLEESNQIIHKRSLYKNLYPEATEPRRIKDVKVEMCSDIFVDRLTENWISTYDGMLNSTPYPKLNYLLLNLFNKPSVYEK